jgi:adenine-specific DNA methylase
MKMNDNPRLIERAFPLKQASLDSVHEKNVRHGHISTLHIWPARRPLAACRAALIATLLPDPGTPEKRKELCEKIGGKVVQKIEKKKMPNGQTVERVKDETEGGILHWKREAENAETLEWFRQEIRKAYGGRAPRVLDPFAGGGAIPLEAMRLGCEATAVDINPVAWFVLKCTLEYPQKLAGKTLPLPDFILEDEEFMEAFYKAHPHLVGRTKRTKKQAAEFQDDLFMRDKADSGRTPKADLAWHVRAWGKWVLARARKELARFYPTYADFEPLKPGKRYEKQPTRLVPLKEDGTPDIDVLNREFSKEYLTDKKNPRWMAKPTVAYLWARTVTCKNCRATVPLLKTRWLSKKDSKRVLLTMEPNKQKTSVVFGIENDVPLKGGNAAQRREHDKQIGAGTMSRAGSKCPCCGTIATAQDIRLDGQAGRMGCIPTAVIMNGGSGKHYRSVMPEEHLAIHNATTTIDTVFSQIPFGVPQEPTPIGGGCGAGRAFSVQGYGLRTWRDLFNSRQLTSTGAIVATSRLSKDEMAKVYAPEWVEALQAYLACCIDRLVDYNSTLCMWGGTRETIAHTFTRFALPITWDYCETNAIFGGTGSYSGGLDWVARYIDHALVAFASRAGVDVCLADAVDKGSSSSLFDAIVTDPPYYDAIPYADLADFFYVWLRRAVGDLTPGYSSAFQADLCPKWNAESGKGELIDDASRFDGDAEASKQAYESGMHRAFVEGFAKLRTDGRMFVVFANKQPDAWETLASSMIRAGALVVGSWPIITEMRGGVRNFGRASLASSVWLICKKRPETARPGWDNKVLEEMRANIAKQLREFWDAGIRGPDFVWAATGPALEAYSKHPVVKKANDPGKTMEVGEFLSHVRRMVVDFVVGQVLTGSGQGADLAAADRMDAPTAYYLLHRHDFGLEEAPSGACILYATACGLSDKELESTWDILARTGGDATQDDDDGGEDADPDAEAEPDTESDSGSKVKLKTWAQRKNKSMGYEASGGQPVPLIDRIHRLMHLWRAGDAMKVDEYLDEHGLRRQELFKRLLQSLIELSRKDGQSQELQILESLSNHVQGKGATREDRQAKLVFGENE